MRWAMMVVAALAVMLTSNAAKADKDAWGNVYPAACSREAFGVAHLPPEVRVTQHFLDKATGVRNRVGVMMPTGVMAIRLDLSGGLLYDTRRHEWCHLVAGKWHPGKNGN